MSDLEVSKMKVAELRTELQERGLDTKGVKAVLQERLLAAMNEDTESPAKGEKEAQAEREDEEEVDEVAQEATESIDQDNGQSTEPEADHSDTDEGKNTEGMPAEMMEEDSEPADVEAATQDDEATTEKKDGKPAKEEVMQEETAPEEEEAMQTGDGVKEAEVKDGEVTEVKDVKEEAKEVKVEDEVEAKKDVGEKGVEKKDDKEGDEKDKKANVKQEGSDRDRERRDGRDRGHKDRRDRSPRRRSPSPPKMEEDDDIPENQCVLNKYVSDLNLKVDKNGYSAVPLTMDGFGFLWSGVKFTHGVAKGKVCYQVKLLEHLNVKHLPSEETTTHVIRVGWSLEKTSLQLGEEKFSYGYGGTAKFSTNCKFSDFGEKFGEGDVITTYVDFDAEKPTISYSKNGKDLGVACTINDDLEGNALFPHLLMKNTSIEVNIGQMEEPYFPITEGYTLIGSVPEEDRTRGPLPPAGKKDCEIIMMVGLPGSGKTTWADKYCQEHPEKKYYVLGTNLIMDKMKVMGLRRQRNYHGRFDSLIDKSTKCLNRFFEMAPRKKRNYILDQTNVYPSARRRKMRPFEGFSSKAIVLVPTDEEFKKRIEKRTKEEGKDVPDHAVLEMKANFELPVKGVLFDEVEFVELPMDDATPLVDKYRKEGVDKLGPNYKRYNRDRNRGGQGNRDNRSKYDNRSPRGGNRGGGGGGGYQSRGSYKSGGSSYGGGYRDDRDKGGYGNRSYGSSYSGSSYGGSGYGGSSSGGYGSRQSYGSYGSQGSGYSPNRSSTYSQSSGYNSGGYANPSASTGGYGSQGYAGNYDYSNQYGQQYQQYQQQYQQYYQQQQQQQSNQSYNPYANYYSSYNSTGYQGR